MEADPLATHNNALSCKDFFEVTEIVRSSLADPTHAVQQARDFAERFTHSNNTLRHFISKIASHSDSRVELSLLSQINLTRTEPLIAEQDSSDHFKSHDDDGKKKSIIFCRNKVCLTHLLDLITVLMAAAGNGFAALAEERSWESKDKCVPAESEKTANSFKAFSLRMWRKGVKSAGSLLKDRTAAVVFDGNDEASSKNDTVATCESNNNKNKREFQLQEIHGSKQDESKRAGERREGKVRNSLEEKSLSDSASSPENVIKHEGANEMTTADINTTHATQQKKQRRKLPNLRDGLLATPGQTERRHLTALALVKKLELEKHELGNEVNALKSQLEMLIKDNRYITASLATEKTEKHDATQKCKELQEQLDERERNSRQHAFMLNSRMERLQHAKLAADQGCLNLSLRQERFEVYEEQATIICQGLIETIRKELEERRGLFGVAPTKCNSTARRTLDDFPAAGEGLAMYEAHRKLQTHVLELVKRYRAVIQLLTGTKGEDEEMDDYYQQESSNHHLPTIEEKQDEVLKYITENDEHYRQHSDVMLGVPLEFKSRCDMNHHEVVDHHIRSQNTLAVQQRQSRETQLKIRRKPDKRTRKGNDKHKEKYSYQEQVEHDHDKEETASLKELRSSSSSMVYPRRSNSLDTIDVSRHHDQRSCSSIVALVRSGQRSGDMCVKPRNIDCSACRKNTVQRRKVKKSMSSCNSRERISDVHYV